MFFTSVVIIGKKRGSLHHRCSIKKVFLEISQNSEESTCARVAFLMKLQAKKETLTQVFSCEFCEISKNNFCNRTPLVVASENRYQTSLCAIAFLDYTCKSKNVTLG